MKKLIWKTNYGIQNKLFSSFLLLTLFMSVLISVCSYFITFRTIKERISSSFSLTLDYVCNSVNAELKQIHSLSDYLFVNDIIKDAIVEGPTNTVKALSLNDQVNEVIKQYTLSHIFVNINSITISGYNNYYLNYALNYFDVPQDKLYTDYKNWEDQIHKSNGKVIWLGLITRHLNPAQDNSPLYGSIILIRSIKNANYSEDIGMISISVNPRLFTDLIKPETAGYPALSSASKIYILDSQNNILNTGEGALSNDELTTILGSTEAYQSQGYLLTSKKYLAFIREASEEGWKVIGTMPLSSIQVDRTYIFYVTLVAFILSIIACTLAWLYIASGIFTPLKKLAGIMKNIEKGNTSLRVNVNGEDEIGLLGRNFNSMLERIESLHKQNLDKEIKVRNAEYRALQSQINPHFLYNTLNSIRWMSIILNAENIKNAIDAFWTITKYSTDNYERYVTVEQEIHIVRQYINLQKIAYPNKFEVIWNVDAKVNDCKCIKFFLQPIVENSILHGILPGNGSGVIFISIFPEEDKLVFNVFDDGVGMSAENIDSILEPRDVESKKSRVGLLNIIERIKYAYDNRSSIDISSEQGYYTNIVIRIPLEM